MSASIDIEDGIIAWYNGPEWDDVAFEEFEKAEAQLEAQMRMDADWSDRTGNARAGLTAKASEDDGVVTMALSHTVSYGYWLEVVQNGRFAILGPTIEQHGRRLTYNAWRRIKTARKGST